jgi:hypothetical protein
VIRTAVFISKVQLPFFSTSKLPTTLRISMLQLSFVIPCCNCMLVPAWWNCRSYFHATSAILISTWQLPFHFEISPLTIVYQFKKLYFDWLWQTWLSSRSSLLCANINHVKAAVFCPFCIPRRLSNWTRQSKLLSTGECWL